MASTIDAPSFGFSFIERKTYYSNVTKPIDYQESSVLRRSGNYKPPRCVSLLSKQATRRTHTRTIHNSVRNFILMASTIDAPSSGFSFIERRTYYSNVTKPMDDHESAVLRRSGNYKPPRWENDYIQSLRSNYVGDTYLKRVAKLKEDVKILLDKLEDSLDGLELIDDLQRLGVSYHFEEEIKRILERIHINKEDKWSKEEDFLATALKFRLLRQYNYDVPQEVFKNFKDKTGNFKTCICEDIRVLLHLYEASFLSFRDESILEEARYFTTKFLKQSLEMSNDIDENLDILVRHALELPLHWRVPRLEARWFIDVYEERSDMKPILLELAKLDFNMVQATHLEELKYLSRWWKNRGLAEKFSFFRDRLMETFLWHIMVDFKPQGSNNRINLTMVGSLLTVIDDMYDAYGTLDELELFTNAIGRWDIAAMEQLPDYMKICFLAIFNTTNEIGYDVLRERSIAVIPFLQKMWEDLCKRYLVEAKWYYSGYTPSFEEYMNNGWISISIPLSLVVPCISTNSITKEGLESAEKYSHLIQLASIISKLLDDLATSTDEIKRGDVPKSIQCYMHETGASEEDARQHIKSLIDDTWKELNDARPTDSLYFDTFIGVTKNMVRSFHCMYQYGDGYGSERGETKDRILSILINPIPLL